MKKIFFFCFFLSSLNILVLSRTVYSVANDVAFEEVNPTIKKKTQTKYSSEDQIKNQYKGKLKYKPINDGLSNYRLKRIYTNFYATMNKFDLGSLTLNNTSYTSKVEEFKKKNSFEINIVAGYYITNNIAIELEYYNFEYDVLMKKDEYIDFEAKNINKINANFSTYSVNVMLEVNYAKLIPYFGVGAGYLVNKTKLYGGGVDQLETEISDIKLKFSGKMVYSLFAGLEYAFSNKFLLTFRYKYLSTLESNFFKKKENYLNAEFKINVMSLGIKYLW